MRLIDADAFAEALWCEYDRRELFMNECAEKGMWETRYGAKIERNTIAEIVHGMDEAPTIDAVPRKAFDGILWENDVMRKQLKDIVKSFGEKMDDVVKVVRCKDCRLRDTFNCGMQFYGDDDDMNLYKSDDWTQDDGFCYWGERKDV